MLPFFVQAFNRAIVVRGVLLLTSNDLDKPTTLTLNIELVKPQLRAVKLPFVISPQQLRFNTSRYVFCT
jgi:hypothetical protein